MSNRLKELVSKIQAEYSVTQADIAKKIGYSRPYFTKAIAEGVEGKVLDKLKLAYPKILQKDTNQEPIPIKNTDLNKQIGTIEERLIRLEGYTTVLFDTAVATLSQATGRQAATIRAELSEAVTMVLKHSLEELRKKGAGS